MWKASLRAVVVPMFGIQVAVTGGAVAWADPPQTGPYLYNIDYDRCVTDIGPGAVTLSVCAPNAASQQWTMHHLDGYDAVNWIQSGNGRCLQHNSNGGVVAEPCTNTPAGYTDATQIWLIGYPEQQGEDGCTLRALTSLHTSDIWGGWLVPSSDMQSVFVGDQSSWGSDDRVVDWLFHSTFSC
ncbi:hypothetical protein VMT65_12905 [Nocardia sp. CDC153]|uniref:hypothetical protein n=1 Tax=Nocardia sp. CDC153 TaxID=3112167 RepID=UPI002DBF0FD9|nr:hypothetical protein [Nocardia sp. CDC153]MEC3953928.1 hypothetical protein [Nocardia sp. CDC153]